MSSESSGGDAVSASFLEATLLVLRLEVKNISVDIEVSRSSTRSGNGERFASVSWRRAFSGPNSSYVQGRDERFFAISSAFSFAGDLIPCQACS